MGPPRHPSTLATLATLALLLVTGVAAVDTGGINDGGGSAYGEGSLYTLQSYVVCVSSEVFIIRKFLFPLDILQNVILDIFVE